MSYRVELILPSCCAEKLDLAAEVEGCPPEKMLVKLFMVGLLSWSASRPPASEASLQTLCNMTTVILMPLMQERWVE